MTPHVCLTKEGSTILRNKKVPVLGDGYPKPKLEDATMTIECSKDSNKSDMQGRPSEAEIIQLIQKTAQEYEEYMTLADLSDYPEVAEVSQPSYLWGNPVGLVVTGELRAGLV